MITKILPSSFAQTHAVFCGKNLQTPSKQECVKMQDSFQRVSFKGVKDVKDAQIQAFSDGLINLVNEKRANFENIEKLARKILPNINVKSIDELGDLNKLPGGKLIKCACLKPNYDDNFKLVGMDMYLADVDYGDKKSVCKFIDTTVYEFSHALGHSHEKEPYLGITKYVKSRKQADVVFAFADRVFSCFEIAYINQTMQAVTNNAEKREIAKYQTVMPRSVEPIDDLKILRSCRYNNYDVFKKDLTWQFDFVCSETIKAFKENGLYEQLPFADRPSRIKRMTAYVFMEQLSGEIQAHKDGISAVKQYLGIKGPTTLDYKVGTYELIEKAFKSKYS